MKKLIAMIVIILSFLAFPATGQDSYRIRLKNGGEFKTIRYWSEGDQIKFYIYGGIAGVQKDSIRKIEKTTSENIIYTKLQNRKKVGETTPKVDDLKDGEKEEYINYYKEKKSQLEAELKRALDRVREAAKNNDLEAKEKARGEAKEISEKMYALTAELTKKNNGKMPEGWWDKK